MSLDLTAGARPVTGVLRAPGKPEREFAGWTELFAALEATLVADEPRAVDPPATSV